MSESMLKEFNNQMFRENLVNWFHENKRDLPWRKTGDPYHIWISEIMLQQTKVDTVIDYYNRFTKQFPTIYDLARADEQLVLKEWEGLGYYSRARNLHHAAGEVVEVYEGAVPNDPKLLGTLKGIGPYTQGAIMSIAFHQPEPAVDGNVMRVLSRVLLIRDNISENKTRKLFETIVRELISRDDPSAFNQGLMELGALICTPKKPACLICPVRESCRAYDTGEVEQLPVKLKAKKQKKMAYYVLLIRDEKGRIAIEKRPEKGLLANLWQFPMVERDTLHINENLGNVYGLDFRLEKEKMRFSHVFSHIIWDLSVHEVIVENIAALALQERFHFVETSALDTYPFSVSHLKIIAQIKE